MKRGPWWCWFIGACLLAVAPAAAQSIGGNASIAVTGSTARVQLPATLSSYPFALLEYGVGAASQEIFYKLGGSTVNAATTDNALPANGICVNVGPNGYVAAITATSTGTLRITQMSVCPP